MGTINIIFDFVLIAAAVWMVIVVKNSGLGGVVGSALSSISMGAIVLGLAHVTETITFEVFQMDAVLVEFIHRTIILIAFILLIRGFQGLGKLKMA